MIVPPKESTAFHGFEHEQARPYPEHGGIIHCVRNVGDHSPAVIFPDKTLCIFTWSELIEIAAKQKREWSDEHGEELAKS